MEEEFNEEFSEELKKCVHISVGTGGAEILISSTDPKDDIQKLLNYARKLIDRYYTKR